MQEMYREEFWRKQGIPRELYPEASSKDAPVPPDLPVPNCDCGRPDTASRCFYTCTHFNVSNCFRMFFLLHLYY